MKRNIRIGIVGYGNLGQGVEIELSKQKDMKLVSIFTRRNPKNIKTINEQTKVLSIKEINNYQNDIDVMVLCGSSKEDLRKQTPDFSKHFNTVDSFDIHEEIENHFIKVNEVAKRYGHISIISVGWDPGIFSLHRLLGEAFFPKGEIYTLWGPGVSQGHSNALKKIPSVKHGVQYTIPSENYIKKLRKGNKIIYSKTKGHYRICYVVLEKGANARETAQKIKNMPHYFAPYSTEVYFISEEDFLKNHQGKSHGGYVFALGEEQDVYEFSLTLKSNPRFTAAVLLAYARAAWRLAQEGKSGARTIYDISPKYLHPECSKGIRKRLL